MDQRSGSMRWREDISPAEQASNSILDRQHDSFNRDDFEQENEDSGSEPLPDGGAVGERAGCAFQSKYTREVPQADGKKAKSNFDYWFIA